MPHEGTPTWSYWGDAYRIAHQPRTWPFIRDGFDLFSAFFHETITGPTSPSPKYREIFSMMETASQLGIRPSDTLQVQAYNDQGETQLRLAELTITPQWVVEPFPPDSLLAPPERIGHTGNFPWLGPERDDAPRWLWDSNESRTVRATEAILDSGFIAISYTWGRWNLGRQRQGGTNWSLPEVSAEVYPDMIRSMKSLMEQIPASRYFWVDVLCIDQDDAEEKQREIGKQAAIFGRAKATIVYLWTLDADELALVSASVGDLLLRTLQFCGRDQHIGSEVRGLQSLPECIQRKLDGKLRLDPWFTSLWALQEMVLAPAGIWMTKSGHFCKVNNQILTTRVYADAIQLMRWAQNYRKILWDRVIDEYPPLPPGEKVIKSFAYLNDSMRMLEEEYSRWKETVTDSEARVREQRVADINQIPGLFLLDVGRQLPAELVSREAEEFNLRARTRNWIDWTFGQVGLNLCILSTRAAIMAAGANRQTTSRRGDAVRAALRIADLPLPEDWSQELTPGGYPHWLQETLIQDGDTSFVYVSHNWRSIWDRRSENSPLRNAQPAMLHPPPDGTTRFDQDILAEGNPLTSILPSTAFSPMVDGLDAAEYVAHPLTGWHLHADGSVHVPHIVTRHIMKPFSKGLVWIRPNGLPREILCIAALAEHAVRTLDIVVPLIGHSCRVIFLPLLTRHMPEELTLETLDRIYADTERPLVLGIILVGKPSNQRHQPMTYWYKVGTYACNTLEQAPLGWQNGVLVGAKVNEQAVSPNLEDCAQYQHDPRGLGPKHSRTLYDMLPIPLRIFLDYAWAWCLLRCWSWWSGLRRESLWGRHSTGLIVRDDRY